MYPAGPLLLTHLPSRHKPELVKTEKEFEDEEPEGLLARPLREKVKKKEAATEDETQET